MKVISALLCFLQILSRIIWSRNSILKVNCQAVWSANLFEYSHKPMHFPIPPGCSVCTRHHPPDQYARITAHQLLIIKSGFMTTSIKDASKRQIICVLIKLYGGHLHAQKKLDFLDEFWSRAIDILTMLGAISLQHLPG